MESRGEEGTLMSTAGASFSSALPLGGEGGMRDGLQPGLQLSSSAVGEGGRGRRGVRLSRGEVAAESTVVGATGSGDVRRRDACGASTELHRRLGASRCTSIRVCNRAAGNGLKCVHPSPPMRKQVKFFS